MFRLSIFCYTIFCFFSFTNFVSAQNPDLEQILKNLPPEYQKMVLNEGRPKGKLKFEATTSGSAFGLKANVQISNPAVNAAMKGGAVYAIEMGYCDNNKPVAKYMYVLFLNNERRTNIFTVDQSRKKAELNLSGNMRIWAYDCGSKQYRETGSGAGGMQAEFVTAIHQRPRFFQVLAGSGDVNEYMEKVKMARKFYLQNLKKYYDDLDRIRKHPKISLINVPDYPVGTGLPPAPPGISAEDSSIIASGRAMGHAVKAMEWFHSLTGPDAMAQKAAEYANEKLVNALAPDASPEAVVEATAMVGMYNDLVGVVADPQGYLFDKAVNNMMKMVADVNKNYAQQGNGMSQAIDRDARKEMRHRGNDYYAIDAEYMSGLLVKAFDQEIAALEREEALNLPPSSAKGKIWGPGLSENLRAYAQVKGQPIAFSYAHSENQAAVDPKVLEALRKSGYPVPERIPEPKYSDGNFEIDATKPYFTGSLGSSKMEDYGHGAKTPTVLVYFSISTPEDTLARYIDPYGLTIFDLPFLNEEQDSTEKCKYYVSVNGNDNGPGSSTAPFKTIQHALNKAKICRDQKKEVEIIIKDGIYRQSANVTWNDRPDAPMLTIRGEKTGAIFVSTEISNTSWQNNTSGWQANMPLHPQQPSWNTNMTSTPPPSVVVNGQKLVYIPSVKNLPIPSSYTIAAAKITARPAENVTNMNSATVEVGVRSFALKFTGAKNVLVTNLAFRYFSQTGSNQTPGIIKAGGAMVNTSGCRFE